MTTAFVRDPLAWIRMWVGLAWFGIGADSRLVVDLISELLDFFALGTIQEAGRFQSRFRFVCSA